MCEVGPQTFVIGAEGGEDQDLKKVIAAIRRESKAFLNRILTMDETIVSFHTSETKRMSKQ